MIERHQLIALSRHPRRDRHPRRPRRILAYNGKSVEAVGVAAAVTALIGVIKLLTSRSPAANVEQAGTVVQGGQA